MTKDATATATAAATVETPEKKEAAQFSIKVNFDKTRESITKQIEDFNEKYVKKHMETGKDFFDKNYKKVNDEIDKRYKTTKENVEKYRKELNDYIDGWKKYVNNMPVKNNIEKKVNKNLDRIPTMMNLPGKKEIEKLITDLEALNNKVDTLAKNA